MKFPPLIFSIFAICLAVGLTLSATGKVTAQSLSGGSEPGVSTAKSSDASTQSAKSPDNTKSAGDAQSAENASLIKTPKDSWPLFRGNVLSTGVAGSGLPEKPQFLWKYAVHKGAFESTPVIVGGVVYIGDLDGGLYALNLKDGSEKWKEKFENGFYAGGAVRDGTFYIGDQEGMFFAIDINNGKTKWKFEGHGQCSAPNFYKSMVLFGTRDGALYCLEADKGEQKWKFQIEDQIRCFPTIVEGRAFLVGCDSKLHIIDVEKGESMGHVQLNAPAGTTPAAHGDMIYFGTSTGEFLAIDWRKKETRWTFQDKARQQAISSSAAYTPEAVYIAGEDHVLRAFDPEKGTEIWKHRFRAQLASSPVVIDNRVIIAGNDGRITILDRMRDKQLWQYEAGGDFIGSPAVVNGKMVIASSDGMVYCFGEKEENENRKK